MGGGPLDAADYSRGHSALRIADSHRYEVDESEAYWRKDVEAEILRHVADRHDAEVMYHAGDEGGWKELEYLKGLGFDMIRFTPGNHDKVDAEDAWGDGVVAEEFMEWPVVEGGRRYNVAMAHDPTDFRIGLETPASTDDALKTEEGDFYDLIITGDSHFPRHHRINSRTVADHAGALGRIYDADGEEVEHFFPDHRMLSEFPEKLRGEVPRPERSFSVVRFWNGITIYRYDAEELAEAYHYDHLEMGDIGPESVFYFEHRDTEVGGEENLKGIGTTGSRAMTD
ncbi:MAG: hypothetical protein SVQ76_01370 [Candidatus Nanohaloarchaea archaeon]|nr:hypothetical protein [Candidatus Nanohaloarchaea archaeon]